MYLLSVANSCFTSAEFSGWSARLRHRLDYSWRAEIHCCHLDTSTKNLLTPHTLREHCRGNPHLSGGVV